MFTHSVLGVLEEELESVVRSWHLGPDLSVGPSPLNHLYAIINKSQAKLNMDYVPFEPLVSQTKFSSHATTMLSVGFFAFVTFLM